jgi:2-isopropylmalate synthase
MTLPDRETHRGSPVRRAAQSGRFVLCEEAARDGAQGKTLLLAPARRSLFERTAAILGPAADDTFVAMVGFPAIGPEEVAVIEATLAGLERGAQALVCRSIPSDLTAGVALARRARAGRVMFVMPSSPAMAGVMMHMTPEAALGRGLDLLDGALQAAQGDVAIDVCLADISAAHPLHVADAANRLTRRGAELIMLADTVGRLHPAGHRRLLGSITASLAADVVIHCHFHNDLGLGLALNLQALELGHRVFGAAWLGLGERTGLGHTEELLAALATATDAQLADLGCTRAGLGVDRWAPHGISPTAQWLSTHLGLPRRGTDPFVGSGVNAISTGTPFVHPPTFQPYDAEALLGIPAKVDLTHLASDRVVEAVAQAAGHALAPEEVRAVRDAAKRLAYGRGRSAVDLADAVAAASNARPR